VEIEISGNPMTRSMRGHVYTVDNGRADQVAIS